ncbi:MAG: ABC transporter ATP-binding protein [bacterium]
MIKLKNVFFSTKEFSLENINLDIEKQEYFIILGPTGSGKTLLLETILGFNIPCKGKIYLEEKDITFFASEKRNIGFVPQGACLFPHLNVFENICFGLKIRNMSIKEIQKKLDQFEELLEIKYLFHRFPDKLSGGEKQKVAIARALTITPKILILDEPLTGIDSKSKNMLLKLFAYIHKTLSITILQVTHNFEEAFILATRIGIINKGSFVQIGTPNEIFQKPNSEFVSQFVGINNIFKGKIIEENGKKFVDLGNIKLFVVTEKNNNDEINVFIRPENILISQDFIFSSAKNCFSGIITEIIDKGSFIYLNVMAVKNFISIITHSSFEEMNLCLNKKVYLTFKSSSIHIF